MGSIRDKGLHCRSYHIHQRLLAHTLHTMPVFCGTAASQHAKGIMAPLPPVLRICVTASQSTSTGTYLVDKGVKCSQRGCAHPGLLVAEVGEKTRKHGIVLRANSVCRHLLAQIGYCIAGCLQHKVLVTITNSLCPSCHVPGLYPCMQSVGYPNIRSNTGRAASCVTFLMS